MRRTAAVLSAFLLGAALWAFAPAGATEPPQGGTRAPQNTTGGGSGIEDYTPGAPTTLTGTLGTPASGAIDLSWTAPSAGTLDAVDGYQIERSDDSAPWATIVSDTGNTATAYSDGGLTSGGTYNYRVSARNGTIVGAASNETGDLVTELLGPGAIYGTQALVWVDASATASITYSSGTLVSSWDDLGTTGSYDFSAPGGSEPGHDTTAGGGLGGVVFASGAHMLTTLAPELRPHIAGGTISYWAVVTPLDGTTFSRVVHAAEDNASVRGYYMDARMDVAGDPAYWTSKDAGTAAVAITTSSLSSGTLAIVLAENFSSTWRSVSIDDAGEGINTASSLPVVIAKLGLGCSADQTPTALGNFVLHELLIVENQTAAQKTAMLTYLGRWP